jgi:Ni,Fe-hydrogenase III small subunit
VALPSPPPAAEVAKQIRRTLGRSLSLRHLDSGSCNACDWELTALLNPVYDVRRLGIDFVASPRHADGVIVTGPVTRNLETAVRRTYEAVPEPRIVIAVGACATSGGIVGRSYASAGGVAEVLPVDVFIPGCPPRPEAIIFGILLAVGRGDIRGNTPLPPVRRSVRFRAFRRPACEARRGRILDVCNRGATTQDGMHGRPKPGRNCDWRH